MNCTENHSKRCGLIKESLASKLRFIRGHVIFHIIWLWNSDSVCCFALFYQLITPERLICLYNLGHSSANLGLVGPFAVLICSDDIHVLDSWMIFWEKFEDVGCAWEEHSTRKSN